jgi:septum site-determining protein MinD
MAQIISIVSGKGGCGKSLLAAVIGQTLAKEGLRVLLVDLDIFVRGLTVLLHQFRRPSKRISGEITTSELFGVYQEDSERRPPTETNFEKLKIQRFLESDVLPAVRDLGEPLDYDDKDLSNEQFGIERLKSLLDIVKDEYDFIFLDNRAGMDSLVIAYSM